MILDQPCRQGEFGDLVGISQPAVSDLVSRGVLENGAPLRQWLLAYCGRLREQAAGRLDEGEDGLSLTKERALLARAQREGVSLKNAVMRGEFASVSLLAQVLAQASQAVAERFDHLPGQLRKVCPNLPPAAIDQVLVAIASARNTWATETAELVTASIMLPDDDTETDDEPRPD